MDADVAQPIVTNPHAPFVGREDELQALHGALARAVAGNGNLTLLEAESGSGKSRLLREFCKLPGVQSFWGQATTNAAAQPFEQLHGVLAGVIEWAQQNAAAKKRLLERLGDWWDMLVALYPAFLHIADASRRVNSFSHAGREEGTLRALVAFFEALGSVHPGSLIILDDCQWSDNSTMRVLADWQNRPASCGSRHLAIVAAYRASELAPSHPLRAARGTGCLKLEPLSDEQTERLSEQMAGVLDKPVANLVRKLARGNPFMVLSLLQGFNETGMLVRRNGILSFSESASANDSKIVGDANLFLKNRIALLPAECVELLKTAALIGKEFDFKVVTQARRDSGAAEEALQELLRRNMLQRAGEQRAGEERYVFMHDKVREAVLTLMPAQEKASLHELIAGHLARHAAENSFAIAYHYDAANKPDKALRYALQSTKEALSRRSLEAAERQYRIAWRAVSSRPAQMQQSIAAGLGEVLAGRGRYAEALTFLKSAYSLSDKLEEKTRLGIILAKVQLYCGDVPASLACLEESLALYGVKLPRSKVAWAAHLIFALTVQAGHTFFPALLGRRPLETQRARRDLDVASLYMNMGYPLYFGCRLVEVLITHLRALNMVERYPVCELRALMYGAHSVILSTVPFFSRGIAYGKRAERIWRELKDEWGFANSLFFYGCTLLGANRLNEALEVFLRATQIFNRLGYRWDENISRCNIGIALYRLGNLKEAGKELRRTFEDGRETGDIQALAAALSDWAKATGGSLPLEALQYGEAVVENADLQSKVVVMQARAVWYLGEGHCEAAIKILTEAWNCFRSRGVTQEYVLATVPWLVTAWRMQIEQNGGFKNKAEKRHVFSIAKSALRIAGKFRNNLPQSLRELAALYALAGQADKAREFFGRSAKTAEKQGARYELAQTLLLQGRAGLRFGWSGAEEQISRAEKSLRQMGARLSFHDIAADRELAARLGPD